VRLDFSDASGFLYLFEHLEDTLRGADEHPLERFRQTTPFKRVATGAGAFGHAGLLNNALRAVLVPAKGR
jgi:hypothetical protein